MDHYVEGTDNVRYQTPARSSAKSNISDSNRGGSEKSGSSVEMAPISKGASSKLKAASAKMASSKSRLPRADSLDEEHGMEIEREPPAPLVKSNSIKRGAIEPVTGDEPEGSPDKRVNAKLSMKPIPQEPVSVKSSPNKLAERIESAKASPIKESSANESVKATPKRASSKDEDVNDVKPDSAAAYLKLLASHNNLGLEPGDGLDVTVEEKGDEDEGPRTEIDEILNAVSAPPSAKKAPREPEVSLDIEI
jgi:hypothetical protein